MEKFIETHSDEEQKLKKRRVSTSQGSTKKTEVTDFELLKKIGQGGFGEVYLCRKRDTKEVLALKIIDKTFVWAQNKLRSVKNERDVLARGGEHDQLVQMHYSFQDPKYLYLAMEYCPGGDLYHLLQSLCRLEIPDALLYMAEMVAGVHALHSIGYIHRDLKPDNFLIDAKGHLKLADFGLSKEGVRCYSTQPSPCVINNKSQIKMATGKSYSMVGSPDYMSPEVINAPQGGYGEEVDWWSLGCLFYDMVCGVTPFCGNTPHEVFENISNWEVNLPLAMEDGDEYFTEEFKDLLLSLLCAPEVRLGKDVDLIKNHPFFVSIDWDNLKNTETLFIPRLSSIDDISYFKDPMTNSSTTPRKMKAKSSFSIYYDSQLYQKTHQPVNGALLSPLVKKPANDYHARVTQSEQKIRPRANFNQITNTPLRGAIATPVDKQILGFSFVRTQTTQQRIDYDQPTGLPVFDLLRDENNEIYIDDDDAF